MLSGIRFHQSITLNPLQAGEVLQMLARLLANGVAPLLPLLVAAFAFAIWRSRNPAGFRLAFISLVMITAILLINSRIENITFTRLRYFLIVWPFIMILFAYGLTSLSRWRGATIALLLLWSAAGLQFDRSGEVIDYAGLMARDRNYPPLHEYVHHLEGRVVSNDFLLGFAEEDRVSLPTPNSSHTTSDYYLQVQLGIDGVFLHASLKRYRLESDVRDILAAHPHVLLAHDPSDVPPNYVRTHEIISGEYIGCANLVDKPELHIQRFAHPLLGCEHEPRSISFDNGIEVLDYAAKHDPKSDSLEALLWWDVPNEAMLDRYNISLQVITPEWQNVRQQDRHLYDNLAPWSVLKLSTEGLQPGSYRLMLVLYDRDTGERMAGVKSASEAADKIVPILDFNLDD